MFAKIWEERRSKLKALAAAVLPNPSQIEDVLQEAFVRLFKSPRTFTDPTEAFRYVRAAVLNTAIDHYRDNRTDSRRSITTDPVDLDQVPLISDNPLELLLEKHARIERETVVRELRSAIDSLPDVEREALMLFFGPERPKPLKGYCEERGVAYSTLRGRMLRAVDHIRKQLQIQSTPGLSGRRKKQ